MKETLLQGNEKKVTILRKTLEASLEYLACIQDGEELKLDIGKRENIDEGQFICTKCDESYEIENGVPQFVKFPRQYDWDKDAGEKEIAERIIQSVGDVKTVRAQISTLGNLLYGRFSGDRLLAIRKLFDIVTEVIKSDVPDIDQQIVLLGAANEARYDLEIYRNALISPYLVLSSAANVYNKNGIVLEGGCATGDCLNYAATAVPSDFFIGADISSNLARQAQSKAGEKTLFIQADVHSLPLKSGCIEILIEQNIWDRLADPPKAVQEIRRLLTPDGSTILSQCDPPQYASEDGRIVYVPEGKRLGLRQIIDVLGMRVVASQNVIWTPWTVFDGQETLPTLSYHATRLHQ